MKKYIALLILIIPCLALFAKGNSDNTSKTTPLKVGMELQYPPFEMSDQNGNPTGISVEIAKDLGVYLNRPVVIENIAWTGLIPSLQTGKVDIIISSMGITKERAKVVDFSIPYIRAGLSLLIYKDSSVQSFNDLNNKGITVAVKSGTTGAILAMKELPKATIRSFDEVAACVLEVSQGKADAFIYDPLTVYENQKKHKDSTRLNIQSIGGSQTDWGFAIKKGNKELKEKSDQFIKEYRESGGFDKLSSIYLGEIKQVFEESGEPFFFDIKSEEK